MRRIVGDLMGITPASPAPICLLCAHYRESYRCDAFPEGIPFDVIASRVDHRDPIAGDRDVQFEPITTVAAEYAEDLFLPIERPSKSLRRRTRKPVKA